MSLTNEEIDALNKDLYHEAAQAVGEREIDALCAQAREANELRPVAEAVNTHARDKAAIKALREALIKAQYYTDDRGTYCTVCERRREEGHSSGCSTDAALKLLDGRWALFGAQMAMNWALGETQKRPSENDIF